MINDTNFIALLKTVQSADDLFNIYRNNLNPTYILTLSQLQTVLNRHKMPNASKLCDAYARFWQSTALEEVVIAEVQRENEISVERLEEVTRTIFAIQNVRAEITNNEKEDEN